MVSVPEGQDLEASQSSVSLSTSFCLSTEREMKGEKGVSHTLLSLLELPFSSL